MSVFLFGLVAALGWGVSDFIAQFTARALGHGKALMYVLGSSTLGLTFILLLWTEQITLFDISALVWLLLTITGATIGSALFFIYWAFSRGPISVAAPIIASYPALNVLFSIVSGEAISYTQYALMVFIIIGAGLVAKTAKIAKSSSEEEKGEFVKTVYIAFVAMVLAAVAFGFLAESSKHTGETLAVVLSRWIAFFVSVILYLMTRRFRKENSTFAINLSAFTILILVLLQGFLDVIAYLSVAAGSMQELGIITIVISSTFGVITTVIARIFLRENVMPAQWVGIFLIGSCVAALSYFSG